MRIVIVGAGEVGFHIARRLSEERQDVVLIDKDPQKLKHVAEHLDVQTVPGSGISPKTLRAADITGADMLVAATDSDETNLISCLLAKHFNPYMLKIARVRNEEYLEESALFGSSLLGIDRIINPQEEMAKNILALMEIPEACEVLDLADGRVKVVALRIPKDSSFAGRPLASFDRSQWKLLVGAILRKNQVIIPTGKDSIQGGDLVYLVVQTSELDTSLNLFGIRERALKSVMIIGGGETGTALARVVDHSRITAKFIEKDPEKCALLAEKLKRVIVIQGDATDRDLLEEENIHQMDLVVTLTGDEESNILISLLAKSLGAKKTITRISKLTYIPIVSAIGIDTVVSPRLAAVRAILQYIRPGKIISVAPLKEGQAEAIEAEALETSDLVNVPLSKVKMPKGALVAAIVRGETTIIPQGSSIIQPGDRLILFALHEALPKLEKLLTVKLEYF